MYHLRLNKALSYTGAISATRENPDVFTDDEATAVAAVASGYFDLIEVPTEPEAAPEPAKEPVGEPAAEGEDPDGYVDVTVSSTPDFETLAAMTKAELTAFAKERDISLDKCKTMERGAATTRVCREHGVHRAGLRPVRRAVGRIRPAALKVRGRPVCG